MKKLILLSFVILFPHNSHLYSQSGWVQQYSGVSSSFYSVHFVNSSTGWVCGADGKILKTTNSGVNWNQQTSNTTNNLQSVFFLNESTGWCAGGLFDLVTVSRMVVVRTDNGGLNWTLIYDQPNFTTYFESIHFTDELNGYAVAWGSTGFVSDGGLYKTVNGGYNWLPVNHVRASVEVEFSDANTGWVLGNYWDDTGHDTGYIYKTINGNNWTNVYKKSKVSMYSSHFLNNITGWISGFDRDSLVNDKIILKTTNAGSNWDRFIIDNNISLGNIFFSDKNNGWGCDWRIYKTTNSGQSWNLQYDETGILYNSIYFADSLTGWAVGSNGKILSTITGGINSVKITSESIPGIFSLLQNYPNPFNPNTVISYRLAVSSYTTLKVYDISGKEISVLVNEKQNAGIYNFDFNGYGLASGVYFYKITADGYSDIKKMTLMK